MKHILLFLGALFCISNAFAKEENLLIESGKKKHRFEIEIADTPTSRMQGLMFREKLDADKGMLFVFDKVSLQSFWMQNTLIPLDMIFIKSDGTIAKIHPMAKPKDLTMISSGRPVKAVLEINGGQAEKLGLKPGDRVIYDVFAKEAVKPLAHP